MTTELKRTPIFPLYAQSGSPRCIDFGGWELPVQFTGIQKEHEAVREQAGLFDVSHMGEVIISGKGSLAYLQQLLTNDASRLQDGQAQYTLMCYPTGGVVDDLLVYRLGEEHYMLVINASNIDKDIDWMKQSLPAKVTLENISEQTALIALQGPQAVAILQAATQSDRYAELAGFSFIEKAEIFGVHALISRTGYTGEDGYELYVSATDAPLIWEKLLQAGEPLGLIPCGLGARDTLRFEARLPLYGQELSADISPLEAGLGYFVKLDKEHFTGKEALVAQKEKGLSRKLVGVEMIDRGIPRPHYPVYQNGRQIGEVTTGTQSPTLKRNLGLALIEADSAALGTPIELEIRGKMLKAEVVKAPFYKRASSVTK